MKFSTLIRAPALVFVLGGCALGAYDPAPSIAPRPISDEDIMYFTEHALMVPVDGLSPSDLRDSFDQSRSGGRTHRAIDILAPRGTPIVAAISGHVLRLRQNAAGGITVYLIDDSRRYVYYYAHLDHYADAITEGLAVRQGFVIGYVGTSGNAPPDTPHLHFQAMRIANGQRDWWNGTPVDVRPFMTKRGTAIQ
ncbi:MAG: peptidoglycan DD-metalloendopeptidase family protein [Gemmatimonadaceae bacterium]|nr:peptidoglycan DD-metalloendopeptidase family protein [Gemmatimonadaceae bacterium]MDQ3242248.1 M23 family metallopeptidase [Gemmatimonadota bacterium]